MCFLLIPHVSRAGIACHYIDKAVTWITMVSLLAGTRDFLHFQNMYSSSGAHPATFQSCTGDRADHLNLVNYTAWRSVPPVCDFNLSYFIKFRNTLTLAGQVGNMSIEVHLWTKKVNWLS